MQHHDNDGRRSVLDELMADLAEQPTVRAILARTLALVPEAEHLSLAVLAGERRPRLLGATSVLARNSESLQWQTREGPSRDMGRRLSRSGDLGRDERWPSWGPRVAELGIRSLLSLPMVTSVGRLGTLNLLSSVAGAFRDEESSVRAARYANHAANALRSAQRITGLETALESRERIGIAIGILMERYHLQPDAAFAVLKRASNDLNVKLRDVAAHVAATRELPS